MAATLLADDDDMCHSHYTWEEAADLNVYSRHNRGFCGKIRNFGGSIGGWIQKIKWGFNCFVCVIEAHGWIAMNLLHMEGGKNHLLPFKAISVSRLILPHLQAANGNN